MRFCPRCLTPSRTRNVLRVTVVTPNYNHAQYLPGCIDSVLAQTFQDIELIILDDASTDSSREIIELYNKNQRAKSIFNQPRRP